MERGKVMNKVLKGFIIGALICVGLGIIILIGAICGGGKELTKEYLAKHEGRIGAITYSVDTPLGKMEEWTVKKSEESVIPITGVENLDIEFVAGKLKVKKTEGKDITLRTSDDVVVKQEGDTLKIRMKKKEYFLGDANYVTIEIPESVIFDQIHMDAGAAEVIVERIEADQFDVDLGAGALHIEDLICEEGSFHIGAGEVDVENGEVEKAKIDVGMGAFFYQGVIGEELDADCGMGAISMELEGDESDYNYDVDVDAGDIRIGSRKYSGMNCSEEIDNDGIADFNLDCDMGSIEIKFE